MTSVTLSFETGLGSWNGLGWEKPQNPPGPSSPDHRNAEGSDLAQGWRNPRSLDPKPSVVQAGQVQKGSQGTKMQREGGTAGNSLILICTHSQEFLWSSSSACWGFWH